MRDPLHSQRLAYAIDNVADSRLPALCESPTANKDHRPSPTDFRVGPCLLVMLVDTDAGNVVTGPRQALNGLSAAATAADAEFSKWCRN